MAHQAEAYPDFCSMKQLVEFLLPPGWDASPLQGYPQHYICRYPFIHLGGTLRVVCLAQAHNKMLPARPRTRTARFGVERTNHQATAPIIVFQVPSIKFAGTHLYTWVERGTVRVKCVAQELNAVSPVRAQTRTIRIDLETSALTMRPPRLPHKGANAYKVAE